MKLYTSVEIESDSSPISLISVLVSRQYWHSISWVKFINLTFPVRPANSFLIVSLSRSLIIPINFSFLSNPVRKTIISTIRFLLGYNPENINCEWWFAALWRSRLFSGRRTSPSAANLNPVMPDLIRHPYPCILCLADVLVRQRQ